MNHNWPLSVVKPSIKMELGVCTLTARNRKPIVRFGYPHEPLASRLNTSQSSIFSKDSRTFLCYSALLCPSQLHTGWAAMLKRGTMSLTCSLPKPEVEGFMQSCLLWSWFVPEPGRAHSTCDEMPA